MSANLSGFNAEEVEPYDNSPVPPGWHKAIITDSGFENTKQEGNQKLSLKHQITEGESEGRVIYGNLNLINANDQAVEIAQRELSSVCRAVGVMQPGDSSDLHDIEMMIKVAPRKDDPEKTEIKAWKSLADYAATPSAGATKPAAKKPAFAAKAQGQGKTTSTPPAQQAAAGATKAGPKWASR